MKFLVKPFRGSIIISYTDPIIGGTAPRFYHNSIQQSIIGGTAPRFYHNSIQQSIIGGTAPRFYHHFIHRSYYWWNRSAVLISFRDVFLLLVEPLRGSDIIP
jgi:hypothetical protein